MREGAQLVIPLHPLPSPSSGTCACAVTRPVAAESAFASLDLTWNQGGSEGAVVVAADH